MDWLDVTATRNLSYNQAVARLDDADFLASYGSGWRHASYAELDGLIQHFGYVAQTSPCPYGEMYCDANLTGDSTTIELMIRTLGDTYDAYLDEYVDRTDVSPTGTGYTHGLLGSKVISTGGVDVGVIYDNELVWRDGSTPPPSDFPDNVRSLLRSDGADTQLGIAGSWLVRDVPIPAAAWLFGTALLGLAGIPRRKKS